MPNLARTLTPSDDLSGSVLAAALLDVLRTARVGSPPLPELPPATYAQGHAAFELLSDQRRLITEHLTGRLLRRPAGPVAVFSAGCGDGTLDARLAATLCDAEPDRAVRYVGVDPYAASARAFAAALHGLDRPGLDVDVHTSTFDDAPLGAGFDVVTFVHSMYYVPDVARTLQAAYDLLRPGGELLVLSAPRAELNALVEVLAPPIAGHEQWFSDDVELALLQAGLDAEAPLTLEARWDATAADDGALDFAVQALLTDDLRPVVRAYLDAVAVPDPASYAGVRVPHPVDVYRVVRS
ncbi:MAG: ubiG 2 [Nocardioides sp.]|nr:ubiG 2 [Nocardioides sp.]